MRVAFRSILWQKSKADVYVVQAVSLDQAAQADGNASVFQFDQIQAKAQPGVHFHRPVRDVFPRILERSDAFVADEPQERGIVQQRKDKFRIVGR